MAKKNVVGSWAFLIGVVLAVILGLVGRPNAAMVFILVLLGLIVGLLNIADKEVSPFLMAATVLIIASAFGQGAVSGVPVLGSVLQALLTLFVPATIIVAIKHVFVLARN